MTGTTMTTQTFVAVIFNEGVLSDIVIEGWPASLPKPQISVVERENHEFCDGDTLLTIPIVGKPELANCYEVRCNVFDPQFSDLSPATVLDLIRASGPVKP